MKYKIYFADLTHTGIVINANTFPLGIGLVAAYAAKELKDEIDFTIYKFPDNLNKALQSEVPQVLCLSNYAWNSNLSYAFAEYIKRAHPKTITIFGGPNFPINQQGRKIFLAKHPAIDFYIKWDGELAFVSLMKELISKGLNTGLLKKSGIALGDVCYISGADYIEGPDQFVEDLMSLPSPYLTGLLDKFFNYPLMPLIETTRGCPYSCTYCNDGHPFRKKVFRRSQDFISEELRYIAQKPKKLSQLKIADTNFGMYKEDISTSRLIRSIIKEYNWPDRIDTSVGKSHPERLIATNRIINEGNAGILKLGYSFQSTDREVLNKIKRTNPSIEQLLSMKHYREESKNDNLEFLTELILALPGDTLEKHYRSLKDVIDVLGMNNIDIHQLTILDGAELGILEKQQEFQFSVRYRVFVGCLGVYNIGTEEVPCSETEKVVVGNSTLTFDDYIECRVMSLLVKIYIDHGPFKEVFGFIRKLNLSSFEVLRHLKDNFLPNHTSLSNLVESFIEGTKKPLFKNHADLIRFVLNIENMKKFISGEYGQNELLIHRVMAYRDCNDDIHLALKEAAASYLETKGLLNDDARRYIDQAVEFSKLRRFNLNDLEKAKEAEFSFDFIDAEKYRYEVNPAEFKIEKARYRFYYDDKDLLTIQKLIDNWGRDTLHQVGKVFQKNNLLLMRRKVYRI